MKRIVSAWMLLIAMASCASSLDRADQAYAREDWDIAANEYGAALKGATDPQELAHIKPRLKEAKEKAAAAHMASARQKLSLGEAHAAMVHAQRAFDLEASDQARLLLADARRAEAARALRDGKAKLEQKALKSAVEQLRLAQELSPSDETQQLLSRAESDLASENRLQFDGLVLDARKYLADRNWARAKSKYAEAHAFIQTPQSRKEEEFASLMAEGQEAERSGSPLRMGAAREAYGRAQKLGFQQEVVQERIRAVTPRDFRITIHGALVLPFKPQSKLPWDGNGGALDGADELLKSLGGFTGPQGIALAGLTASVLQLGNTAMQAPDCFVIIRVGDQEFGGIATADQDDYQPTWNIGFDVRGVTSSDKRIVSVEVSDNDVLDPDNVGSHQFTLGDLVAKEGPREIPLFSPDGSLQASGLLCLKVSVERLP